METTTKIGIGLAALALGGWALMGSANAAPPAARPDGKTQGGLDGCAAGSADAKAGRPQALNPTDAAGVGDAAKGSTDPVAYLSEYQRQYDGCYASTPKPAPAGGGGTKKPTPPPPGATGPDRAKALDAWGLGCNDGTDAGYAAGYAGGSAPSPTSGAALASGNTAAYRAAFLQAVTGAYSAGSGAAGIAGYEPGTTHASALLAGGKGACSGYFDGWYLKWVSEGAHVGGVRTSGFTAEVGVMGLMRGRAAPRATRRGVAVGQTMARKPRPGERSIGWSEPAGEKDVVYSP